MKLVHKIKNTLVNIPGFKTKRKLVAIESDDWGSIRSNKDNIESLQKQGISNDLYNKYDHLEGEEDLVQLFNVLRKFKDVNGRSPVITVNTIMGNPDFDKIKASNFQNYYWEPFPETLKRVYPNTQVFDSWKQGLEAGYVKPQFHGREHLNVNSWLNDLQKKDKLALRAFQNRSFSYPVTSDATNRGNHLAAFDHSNNKDVEFVKSSLNEGVDAFYKLFGFYSKTMIAPCYVWSDEVESFARDNGILAFQGIRYQYKPSSNTSYKKKFHYTGQRNKLDQIYIVRNAFFEPTHFGIIKSVKDVLERAELLFSLGKPLVIGAHRINFMGGLVSGNRENNLDGLSVLLSKLLEYYPDIEFYSTDELQELIRSNNRVDDKE